ncbi:MAG: hypothetical protein K8U03_21645 [Planctomycetia bacterium]|nr:hypothetical protein [Planctomycetia bacterium]
MRRSIALSAITLIAVAAVSLTASAAEWRRPLGYAKARPAPAAPVAVKQPAAIHVARVPGTTVSPVAYTNVADSDAQPSLTEIRSRMAQLAKQLEQLEAAEAEDHREIVELKKSAKVQPATRPVVRPRAVETIITNDLYPNEYPYGG